MESNTNERTNESKSKNSAGAKIVLYTGLLAFLMIDVYYLIEHFKAPKRNILLPSEFTQCDLISIDQITPTTKYYRMKCKNSIDLPVFHVYIKDDSCQIARAYTPVTTINKQEIGILIRHYKDGVISTMMDGLKVGDMVDIRGPFETIPPYQPNIVKDLVMIAGGTGIAPFYQLIKHVLALDKNDTTRLTLYYCNRNEQEILLKRELDSLKLAYPTRLNIVYALDEKQPEYDYWFDPNSIKTKIPLGKDVACLVCGPDGFVSKVAGPRLNNDQGPLGGILNQLGFNSNQVYKL